MMMKNHKYITLILVGIGILFGQQTVPPTPQEEQKAFDRAIRLEKLKQFEQAEEIYRALLENNPKNPRAFLQLKSLYKRQENYRELENLILARLALFPGDLQNHAELGELYLNEGESERALEYWDDFLEKNSRSQTAYRVLMQMYVRYQFSEQLDTLVQKGRETFNDPSLFSLDLGNIFSRTHNYDKAARELLTYAIYHPQQIQATSSQLLRMSDDETSQPFIETELVERMPENERVVRTLYCDFLFKTGRYSHALQQHVALGIEEEADLDRWLNFANNLRKENQLSLALDAFKIILEAIPHQPDDPKGAHYRKRAGEALYGLALTYEQQILPSQTVGSLGDYFPNNMFFESHFYGLQTIQVQPLQETFALYDSILVSLPFSAFSPQAHFRLGEIKYRITKDYDGALDSFRSATVLSKDPQLTQNLVFRISDVLMAKGEFLEALDFLERQLATARSDEERDKYLLKKCHVLFLSGDIDSTLSHLNRLISYLDITNVQLNDALELRAFVEENYSRTNENGKQAFRMYLEGERLLKQAKLTEAQLVFNGVAKGYPETPIADEAGYRRGKLEVLLGEYDVAVSTFLSLQDSPLGDRASIMIGEIYDRHLNNKQEAVEWYLLVLEDHPTSMLAEPVRYRIREINREAEIH